MAGIAADEIVEHTLTQIQECYLFELPPRVRAQGWLAADMTKQMWTGRMRVVQRGMEAAIMLVDRRDGKLFAICKVDDGAVERVPDSSRYFVIKIQNAQGRHAFVGLAFDDRNQAFDFNVALQEFKKDVERSSMLAKGGSQGDPLQGSLGDAGASAPAKTSDLSLKKGEKIKISIGGSGSKTSSRPRRSSGGGGGGGLTLAPPPGDTARKAGGSGLLAPPPGDTRRARDIGKPTPAPASTSAARSLTANPPPAPAQPLDENPAAASSPLGSSGFAGTAGQGGTGGVLPTPLGSNSSSGKGGGGSSFAGNEYLGMGAGGSTQTGAGGADVGESGGGFSGPATSASTVPRQEDDPLGLGLGLGSTPIPQQQDKQQQQPGSQFAGFSSPPIPSRSGGTEAWGLSDMSSLGAGLPSVPGQGPGNTGTQNIGYSDDPFAQPQASVVPLGPAGGGSSQPGTAEALGSGSGGTTASSDDPLGLF